MRILCLLSTLSFFVMISNASSQRLQSSADCQDCHRSATLDWAGSRHAKSNDNPFYKAMLSSEISHPNLKPVDQCKKCHDPAAQMSPNLNTDLSEGVNCDFCHATRLIKKAGSTWFELIPQKVKLGPYADAISNNHRCEYSPTHMQAEFCITCHNSKSHEYLFGSIEDEWRDSRFSALDIQCQDCHMPALEGKSAPLGKIREVHAHGFYGGYSSVILRHCAKIRMTAVRKNEGIMIEITVIPHSVGHALPTGSALRMVYLTLEASDRDGIVKWRNYATDPLVEDSKAVFMRQLQDRSGRAPVPLWEAQSVQMDQRLYPGEERTLTYSIADTSITHVQAVLNYRLAPMKIMEALGMTDTTLTEPRMIATVIQKVQQGL